MKIKRIPFTEMKAEFKRVLLKHAFTEDKAERCANIFAENSRDGVYSHGLNRFPVFVKGVEEGLIKPQAEPESLSQKGVLETWNGNFAPGMYVAGKAMQRAIEVAKESGIGCVAVKNTNHWMRGGTYGLQAADAGCIGICTSNTVANMPPWGGIDPRLGNNPLVIAVPREGGHIVLDMAMSQFSFGKLQEYQFSGQALPVAGGYDENGNLSTDANAIRQSKRTLPIGFWKGSGLSFVLDILVSALSGGRSVAAITADGKEKGLSQLFLCINAEGLHKQVIEEIIDYTSSSKPVDIDSEISYPGQRTLATRQRNLKEGIPVNEQIWRQVLAL